MANINGNEIYFGIVGQVGQGAGYNETQTDEVTDEVQEVTENDN